MSEIKEAVIPYYAHEGEMVRMERMNKRLWVIILVLIIALIGTNVAWLVYESQFQTETISTEIEAQQDGSFNFVSGGDLNYGAESKNKTDNQAQSP